MLTNKDLTDKDIDNLTRSASLYYQILTKASVPPAMSEEKFVLDFTRQFMSESTIEDLKELPARIRRQEKLLSMGQKAHGK